MKLFGLGIDILEISRMKSKLCNDVFMNRVFSKTEKEIILNKGKNAAQTAAANFCGKEAFVKAIGTGFRSMDLNNIEILRNNVGKPFIQLSGSYKQNFETMSFEISLTHTETTAAAVVIALEED